MTDRHVGYIVTLDKAYREDDLECTITAMSQIKGVISVKPVVQDSSYHIAEMQTWNEMREKIYKLLDEIR